MTTNHPGEAPQTMRLLRTKLFIPQTHPDVVDRIWLVDRLNQGLNRKLTLVCASAGYGKTTLLSAWIRQCGKAVGWVSLDERDNDPAPFWGYFISAIQTLHKDIGSTALAMLWSPQPPALETILTDLLNELAQVESDFLLVLDDYHAIEAQSIHKGIGFLLDNMPPTMHLVIAGRAEPPLALPLMRARRELVELHPEDLRFTSNEASTFLSQVMGLQLDQDEVQALEALTEGWAAGLQLAGIALQSAAFQAGSRSISEYIRSFSGSHRYVFDYLAQEVLNRQPEEIQQFLVKTSILERLCGPLCDEVTGFTGQESGRLSSQDILEALVRLNLFILPLDPQRQWYRYHHLFGDFLRTRLEQTSPETTAELHRRASRWNQRNGYTAEAINHALAAQDFIQAGQLILDVATAMFRRSELTTVRQWLSQLSEAGFEAQPRLRMIKAWTFLATGSSEGVEPELQAIERVLGQRADGSAESYSLPGEVRGALGEISCLRAILAFNRFDLPTVLPLISQAQRYLADNIQGGWFNDRLDIMGAVVFMRSIAYEYTGNIPEAVKSFEETLTLSKNNPHLVPMCYSHLAQLKVICGELRQAEEILRQGLQTSGKAQRQSPLTGMAFTGLGNLYYERNQLDEAEKHLEQGVRMGIQWRSWESSLAGYSGLAWVDAARGRSDQAEARLQELATLAERFEMQLAAPSIEVQKAWLAVRQGRLDAASRWAQTCDIDPNGEIPFVSEMHAIVLARVLLASGKPDEAERLAARLLASCEAGERWGRVIETLCIQAQALQSLGQTSQAESALQRALSLAEPEGYVRTFIDEGSQLMALLSRITPTDERMRAYIERLKAAGEGRDATEATEKPSGAAHAAHTGPLSEREIEVLRLIAQGLTNQEIAEKLFLSLNTVKTHAKNINFRLEVSNRTQAVRRAQEMGLLE
ncbi:MAG: LuxR family transcriptional regulator [Chloroflexota bacterium]|nr:MAG: LuxR family transcriptional regulator [Chloroflexota bacterium]